MKPRRRVSWQVSLLSRPEHGRAGEDRWAVRPGARRWVLCDGASESYDAAGWASELATALAQAGPGEEAVSLARHRYRRRAKAPGDWLAELSRKRGSWSTALVAELGEGGLSLRLSAIGDTEAFVLDGLEVVLAFPVTAAEGFTNTPNLVGEAAGPIPHFQTGQLPLARIRRPSVILATDALAARILSEPEASRGSLLRFLAGAGGRDFMDWAEAEMDSGQLGHDDLSLLWVR